MATAHPSREKVADPDSMRAEWLGQLAELVKTVDRWAIELDWSIRQISKEIN